MAVYASHRRRGIKCSKPGRQVQRFYSCKPACQGNCRRLIRFDEARIAAEWSRRRSDIVASPAAAVELA